MTRNCRLAVATHICAVLARSGDRPATSEWIAGSVNTNPVVVRRLLAALARAGLVISQRGAAGGSLLARPPATITGLDIHRAVDGPDDPPLHRQTPNPACPVGANIVPVLTEIFERAERAREAELASTTLADVLDAINSRAPA